VSEKPAGVLTILTNAIEMEREGKAFFENVASNAKHQRTRDTFVSLVKQEQRHVDILSEELRRLEQGKDWASLQEMNATPTQYPKISVFKDKEIRRMKFDSEAGELEALKLGIKIEKKSMDYYRNAGLESTDPKAREIFSWLVGEEGGHLTILSAEYEYRIKSGFYYDNMEFSLEVE
jgi:rubrerythrin